MLPMVYEKKKGKVIKEDFFFKELRVTSEFKIICMVNDFETDFAGATVMRYCRLPDLVTY
jgi:hypothetical protein